MPTRASWSAPRPLAYIVFASSVGSVGVMKSPDSTPDSIAAERTLRHEEMPRPRRNSALSEISSSSSSPGIRISDWAQSTNAGWATP